MWMTPAPEDVAMVKETLRNVRSWAEVEAAWGPPDETITGLEEVFRQHARIMQQSARITQHKYTNIAPTLNITVWELEDGTIDFSYGGKRKPE